MSMRQRHGFTLVELLVATAVFIIGFTAAFGLFLAATRFRSLADDTIKLSLAASSLVTELSLGNPAVPPPTGKPSDYLGSGCLPLPATVTGAFNDPTRFYPYAGVPGSWFTVETCTDLSGQDNPLTPSLHLSLLVVMYPQADPATGLDFKDIYRRMRLDVPAPADINNLTPAELRAMSDALIKRGVAIRVTAVVLRRPPWM